MKYLLIICCIFVLAIPAQAEDIIIFATPEEMAELQVKIQNGKDSAALKLANEYVKREQYAKAEKWYRYALLKDIGRAAIELYALHKDGAITLDDPTLMRDLGVGMLENEAANGDGSSALYLGVMYLQGDYIDTDYAQANSWFLAAEQQSKPMASYHLGMGYINGLHKLHSPRKAIHHFKKASAGGHGDASHHVALAYHTGIGAAQNKEQAFAYYKKGAQQGSAKAMRDLAHFYKTEYNDTANYENWMKRAAALADLDAHYFLGQLYESSNPAASVKHYKAAASQKHHLSRLKVDKSY